MSKKMTKMSFSSKSLSHPSKRPKQSFYGHPPARSMGCISTVSTTQNIQFSPKSVPGKSVVDPGIFGRSRKFWSTPEFLVGPGNFCRPRKFLVGPGNFCRPRKFLSVPEIFGGRPTFFDLFGNFYNFYYIFNKVCIFKTRYLFRNFLYSFVHYKIHVSPIYNIYIN